ncbi:helix-turn-helix domain-containing protein [Streptomyces sp. 4N509B]|uniref:helix-turn-helix domain-containing protein n=1 Tax=Streptomyces sp. 4N509B TaxID=3457413 RepID=UPI003FD11CE6
MAKLERETRGWGTNSLSDRLNAAGYEINPSAVWRIENGKRRVNLDEAIGFAEVFGISLENLVGPPRLAAHSRAMDLVEQIRRGYREVHHASLALTRARDALDAYLAEHPDVREEAEATVRQVIAEEFAQLPDSPGDGTRPGSPSSDVPE